MEVFKLHNLGQNGHLKIIKEKYRKLFRFRNERAGNGNIGGGFLILLLKWASESTKGKIISHHQR